MLNMPKSASGYRHACSAAGDGDLGLVVVELVDERRAVLATGRDGVVDTGSHLPQFQLALLVPLHAVVVDTLTLRTHLVAKSAPPPAVKA